LRRAFDCESVALHALSPEGRIEPWSTRGDWRGTPGDLRDCLSLPLLRGDERVGSLDLRARAGQRFRAGQIALIRTAAGALGAALGARLELERLRHTPGRDPLTGLPDAKSFHARLAEELARARRHGLPLGVATVDLDHFAALNARHGRPAGDAVLREAALLFKLKLRESDVLCRLGGDAFGLILPETDSAAAVRCAERLCRGLEEHRFPRVARVSATGAAAASPRDGVDPAELMERLDQALSVAKKAGRRRVAAPPHAGTH
jgi:diguanylate cyclase (GGDEF)-like protein